MDAKELDFNTRILIKAWNVLAEAMFNISYGVVPDLTQVEPGDDMYALVLHDCAEVIAMMYSKKELTIDEMVYVSWESGISSVRNLMRSSLSLRITGPRSFPN